VYAAIQIREEDVMVETRNEIIRFLYQIGDFAVLNVIEDPQQCEDIFLSNLCGQRVIEFICSNAAVVRQISTPQSLEVIRMATQRLARHINVDICLLSIMLNDQKNQYRQFFQMGDLPMNLQAGNIVCLPQTSRFDDLIQWVLCQTTPHALVDMASQIRVACNQAYADATGVLLTECFHDADNAGRWAEGELHRILSALNASTDGTIHARYLARFRQSPVELPWEADFQIIEGIEGKRYRLGRFIIPPIPAPVAW